MKCRVAEKVIFKACMKGPFKYKKTTIAEASRKIYGPISVRDAWLVAASVFVLMDGGFFPGETNMELAT